MNYNTNLLCRLCLLDNSGNVSIFTNNYDCRSGILAQKIMQIANVQMYEGDGLPTLICRVCLSRVEGFFQFKIQVEKSDFLLRQEICQYQDDSIAHVSVGKPPESVKIEALSVLKSTATVYITDNTWTDSVQSFTPLQSLDNTVPLSTPQEVTDVLPEDSQQSTFVNFSREEREDDKSLLDLSQQEGKTTDQPSEPTDVYQNNQCDSESVNDNSAVGRNSEDQAKVSDSYYVHDNDFFDERSCLDLKISVSEENNECEQYNNDNCDDSKSEKSQSSKCDTVTYCEDCNEHFDKPISLKKHQSLHLQDSSTECFKCPFCSKIFKQTWHLNSHVRTHTGERPFLCTVCSKAFTDKSALNTHMRVTHFTEKTHVCLHCDKVFKLKKQLERHQRIHTGHQYHRCEICGKLFTQKSNLVKHLVLHSGAKPYPCPFCEKPFAQKDNLNIHILRHHSEQTPVVCDLCGKVFKNKMTLMGHKKSKHSNDVKQIICEVCGKFFPDRSCLNSHKWVHSSGEPVQCDVCGKSYPHARAVRVHKRIVHSEVRKYCCDVCGMGFKTGQTLKHHKVVHTGERAFACDECGRCFGQKTALKTHYRIHSGIEPYSCPRCGDKFKWKQTCDKHIVKCSGKPHRDYNMIVSSSDDPVLP